MPMQQVQCTRSWGGVVSMDSFISFIATWSMLQFPKLWSYPIDMCHLQSPVIGVNLCAFPRPLKTCLPILMSQKIRTCSPRHAVVTLVCPPHTQRWGLAVLLNFKKVLTRVGRSLKNSGCDTQGAICLCGDNSPLLEIWPIRPNEEGILICLLL